MNKHVELVKRWLAGEDVTPKELRANSVDADAADARADARADVAWAAARAAHAADAADASTGAGDAAHWVKKYEDLTNE